MGLAWAGAAENQIGAARRDLLALQNAAGGWPQLRSYEPDAYSTGEALVALREAGTVPADPAFRRGIRFLVSTQASKDGTWHVHSRMLSPAEVSPTYFRTGFPYGSDEFLSYAGTCWAVMALLTSLPEPAAEPSLVASAAPDAPAWMRTALLGTTAELAALLDAGLDPNSKTEGGTTLLMMGAPDVDKVRLLLARGADAGARAASGADALSAAAGLYGTVASLQALLDAGAAPQPPEDVRVRKSVLDVAAMTGDLENVKLLLTRGASPSSGSALADAVTTGYADVVRALVLAGANVRLVEGSGINLIHWATITNRAAVIPVLAEAGVGVNVIDAFGFTPLMYAATIDFGDVESVKALLEAGASRTIKNYDERTPLEQAAHFKHTALRDALR
jgi:ankyrin repeat protein